MGAIFALRRWGCRNPKPQAPNNPSLGHMCCRADLRLLNLCTSPGLSECERLNNPSLKPKTPPKPSCGKAELRQAPRASGADQARELARSCNSKLTLLLYREPSNRMPILGVHPSYYAKIGSCVDFGIGTAAFSFLGGLNCGVWVEKEGSLPHQPVQLRSLEAWSSVRVNDCAKW